MTGRIHLALLAVLSVVMLAGCFPVTEPDIRGDLRFVVTNDSGRDIRVTTTASGQGVSGGGRTEMAPDSETEIIEPLTANWSIAIDGAPVLNSTERPELVPPSGADSALLVIELTVDATGPRVTATRLASGVTGD